MPLENFSAAVIINGVVEQEVLQGGETSPDSLARKLREAAEEESKEAQAGVFDYIGALQNSLKNSVIDVLPQGVGGQYDGSKISIAAGTVQVGAGGVSETIARMQEVGEHEAYHKEHNHTASLIVGASAGGDIVAVIGGTAFTEVKLKEALTVHDTGREFVSSDYREYEGTLVSAVSASNVTMDDVRQAVNVTKDLPSIDDESRSREEAVEFRMAA